MEKKMRDPRPCDSRKMHGQPQLRVRTYPLGYPSEDINVTATVTDGEGRFVPGLRQTDFLVYGDDQLVDIRTSAERVPVSLEMVRCA